MILRHRAPGASPAGLTLLEAVVFRTLVVMAMGALGCTSLTVAQLQRAEQERGQASQSLISVVEDVRRTAREPVDGPLGPAPAFTAAYSPARTSGEPFDVASFADPILLTDPPGGRLRARHAPLLETRVGASVRHDETTVLMDNSAQG